MTDSNPGTQRPPSGTSFQAGGTLREGALYVERQADHELPQALLQREFCYVLAPRQIGKSSLRVRASQRLIAHGVRCVTIDLTTIGSRNSSAAEWYYGLLSVVADQLGLADPGAFWEEHHRHSPVHRWSLFLRDQVLGKLDAQIVIFIDEVDALLSLNEVSRDDFFASVRAVYNARADDKRWERLTFCLFGVAMSSDLIQDETRTPFNIGRGIPLSDFTQLEMTAFLPGLDRAGGQADVLLEEIYKWTSGHPYMSQMVCQTLLEQGPAPAQGFEADRVATVVQQLFLRKGRVLEPSLSYAEKCFDRTDTPVRTAGMLRLYQRLRAGERVPSRSIDPVQMALRLTGMATERVEERPTEPSVERPDDRPENRPEDRTNRAPVHLEVRNRIFADVFDARWVGDMTAKRLVAAPLLRWLESGRRDEFLLTGQPLADAQAWAKDATDLTRQESDYLEVSQRVTERERNKRLNVLFLTEFWKSTANYLLLFILADYLEQGLGLAHSTAARVYAAFFSAIYVTPLLGGYLGDRVLGKRRSVFLGILFLALGYFVLAIPRSETVVAAFLLLGAGHGLYKANLPALVGSIYERHDIRRDDAFLRYYLGLNLGAALGPIIVSSLSGHSVMCAAAGVSMVVALLSFQHYPELTAEQTDRGPASPEGGLGRGLLSGLAGVARAAARDNDYRRFRTLLWLVCVVAVPFWLTFYGSGYIAEPWLNSRTYSWLDQLFSPSTTKRLTAAQNSIFLVAVFPLVWALLHVLRKRGREPATYLKMAIGMVLIALAMFLLIVPDRHSGSIVWLVASYSVLAVAELFVVPIGYSLVVALAPPSMLAMALGVWFVTMTLGNNVALWLGALWKQQSWHERWHLALLGGIALGAAAFLAVQMRRLTRGSADPS